MAQRGPISLSESDLAGLVATRVGNGFSKTDVSNVIKAIKAEISECMQQGYKVSLTGLVIFTPGVRAGKKKGQEVRNPATGETKTLTADQPPKFKVRATVSQPVIRGFPTLRSKAGQELLKQLTPVAKKAAPAPAKKKGKGR